MSLVCIAIEPSKAQIGRSRVTGDPKSGRRTPIGLLGQLVRQVDRRLNGLIHAESILQDQTGQEARIDAAIEVVTSGNRRERPCVIDEARSVVETGGLNGVLAEPPHALGRIQEPPWGAQSD